MLHLQWKRWWFCCLLVWVTFCGGGEAFAEVKRLSLKQTLGLLIKRNPSIARERLTIKQARADLIAAQGAFGFDLDLDLNLNRSSLPVDQQVDPALLSLLNDTLTLARLSLSGSAVLRKTFATGTTLSATFRQSFNLNDQPRAVEHTSTADPSIKQAVLPEFQLSSTVLTLQFSQALLRGGPWSEVNLVPVWQSMERIKLVRTQVAMTVMQQVGQTAQAYWDLVYARRNYAIKQGALKLAETQLKNTLALIKNGKLAPLERYQVMQVVATRKGELLVAKDLVANAETQLQVLLQFKTPTSYIPTDPPETTFQLDSKRDLLARAVVEHPQIIVAKKQIKISKWGVMGSKNALLPELNLVANFSFVGSGSVENVNSPPGFQPTVPRPAPTDQEPFVGKSYRTLFDPLSHRFFVGLTLKIPLDNRALDGKLQRDHIEVQRGILELNRLLYKVRAEVLQQYAQVKRTKQRIEIAKVSQVWAKKKLEAEQAKFKLGQSTLFQVLTFQQDLANAQLAALRALIDYRKAIVTLYERAGILLPFYGITPSQTTKEN